MDETERNELTNALEDEIGGMPVDRPATNDEIIAAVHLLKQQRDYAVEFSAESEKGETFYVFKVSGKVLRATKPHPTFEDAATEARRLSALQPKDSFLICKVVGEVDAAAGGAE